MSDEWLGNAGYERMREGQRLFDWLYHHYSLIEQDTCRKPGRTKKGEERKGLSWAQAAALWPEWYGVKLDGGDPIHSSALQKRWSQVVAARAAEAAVKHAEQAIGEAQKAAIDAKLDGDDDADITVKNPIFEKFKTISGAIIPPGIKPDDMANIIRKGVGGALADAMPILSHFLSVNQIPHRQSLTFTREQRNSGDPGPPIRGTVNTPPPTGQRQPDKAGRSQPVNHSQASNETIFETGDGSIFLTPEQIMADEKARTSAINTQIAEETQKAAADWEAAMAALATK